MHRSVQRIKDYAHTFSPELNKVSTRTCGEYIHNFMVVAPGVRLGSYEIEGLRDALKTDAVYIQEKPGLSYETLKRKMPYLNQPDTPVKGVVRLRRLPA